MILALEDVRIYCAGVELPKCSRCRKNRVLPKNRLCVPCQQQELNRIRAERPGVEIPITRGSK